MPNELKILVSGDVKGKFKQLFSRVNRVMKKSGSFDILLCVGEFFGSDESEWLKYSRGELKVPLPTYILGPLSDEYSKYFYDINGCEIAENIIYLGKKGLYNGSSGLKIAYVSGNENTESTGDLSLTFNESDIQDLIDTASAITNFQGVDILISSQWPKGIENYGSPTDGVDSNERGSDLLSYLAKILKPRYHFSGQECQSYERQPYRNHQVLAEEAKHVTRFIALADVDNSAKKKWLYAFTLTPMVSCLKNELKVQPEDVTEMPYKDLNLKLCSSKKGAQQQFFFNMSDAPNENKRKRKGNNKFEQNTKHPRRQPQPQQPCWFCLSGPDVKKHLVVSIGDEAYVALAKGGIVPEHVVILPIGHCRSTLELPSEAVDEVNKYKEALKKYYKSKGMTTIFYERNYKSPHLQIQCVPLPQTLDAETISENFQNIGDSMNIEINEIPMHSELSQIVDVGRPYFYVELDNGKKLLHRIRKGIPINFGREVLCSPPILDMEDRIDWRECEASLEEETKIAEDFRSTFGPFDFAL